MTSPAFARSQADLALPWLPSVAAAVGGAAAGKRAALGGPDWAAAEAFGQLLAVARPALEQEVCSAAAAGSSKPLALLQHAAQLAAHWPSALGASVPPATAENLALSTAYFLAGVCGLIHNSQIPWLQRHAASAACTALRRKQAAALLPTLPGLRAGLRQLVAASPHKRAQPCANQ